jgi:hypothetical protein
MKSSGFIKIKFLNHNLNLSKKYNLFKVKKFNLTKKKKRKKKSKRSPMKLNQRHYFKEKWRMLLITPDLLNPHLIASKNL